MKKIWYNSLRHEEISEWYAAMAQLVERVLGKDEVPGSNPGSSSKNPDYVSDRDFSFM